MQEIECFLPNGGVAIMREDGKMLAYAKVAVVSGKQTYTWVRRGFEKKFKRA